MPSEAQEIREIFVTQVTKDLILRRGSRGRSRGTVRSVFIIEWELPSMSRINSQVKTVYTPGQPCRSAVETGRYVVVHSRTSPSP